MTWASLAGAIRKILWIRPKETTFLTAHNVCSFSTARNVLEKSKQPIVSDIGFLNAHYTECLVGKSLGFTLAQGSTYTFVEKCLRYVAAKTEEQIEEQIEEQEQN